VLDVRRMLLLLEVARQGSVTGAARALSYTPSAVSQQIARLEAEAGQALLERHPRGIALTAAGEVVVARGRFIARQLDAAQQELADLAELRAGRLRIGTFPTAGASLLPLAVTTFRGQHPDVVLTVRSARFAALREMLDGREIEVSLLWDYAWEPVRDDTLDVVHLLDDPPCSSSQLTTASRDDARSTSQNSRQRRGSRGRRHTRSPRLSCAAAAKPVSSRRSRSRRTTTRKHKRWSRPASVLPWRRDSPWSTCARMFESFRLTVPRRPGASSSHGSGSGHPHQPEPPSSDA